MISYFLLPPFMSFLHRLRGGGYIKLPFKLTYFLFFILTPVLLLLHIDWRYAITLGLGYELWCIPAWMGELLAAEAVTPPATQKTSQSIDARIIKWASFGHPVLGCYLRAAIFLVPLVVVLGLVTGKGLPLLSFAFPALAFWPSYKLAYHIDPLDQSSVAEPLVGFAWGAAIALWLYLSGVPHA